MRKSTGALAALAITLGILPANAAVPAARSIRVMARFEGEIPRAIAGLDVLYRFESVPAIVADATPAAIRALEADPRLAWIEPDAPIEFLLDTATRVTRARGIWEGDDAIEVGGDVIDGSGIGIAIVDSGVDGTHPDFAGRMGGSYQVTPAGMVPVPNSTNLANSHGTHVAGIAAGSGAASDGRYTGVAPGATVYGFNIFQGTLSFAAITFDWILSNPQDPPIRVVNNSWRCTPNTCRHPFNGDGSLHRQLATELTEHGIVVTWAAGNEMGDGDIATLSAEATNPAPGIISVANYKDSDTTSRNRCLSSSSSWGSSADPTTWPDVAAPGRSITSTWATAPSDGDGTAGGRNPVTGEKTYNDQTGTSMAAPHVAGIAALMLQTNPSLTPAEVEYLIKRTATPLTGSESPPSDRTGCDIAYVKADPAHPWTGANYAAGHGLVDARAAVTDAIGFAGVPVAPPVEPLPEGFVVSRPGVEADRTLYLTGDTAMTETYPDADIPRVRVLGPTDKIVHTSGVLSGVTFDALKVDVFLGSTAEGGDFFSIMGTTTFVATVERITSLGDAELLHEFTSRNLPVRTLGPIHRDYEIKLTEPVTFGEGERIRLTLSIIAFPWLGVSPPINGTWDVYTEGFTPSRVVLGSVVDRPDPGSRAACERRKDCAMVDALHPYEGLSCAEAIGFRLSWTGPAGSMLLFNCDGAVTACPIVGEPGTVGSCETDALVASTTDDHGAFCTYVLPDGGRGGSGRCFALTPIPDA
jgi:serine protease AprX